jgi:hypothetical protein
MGTVQRRMRSKNLHVPDADELEKISKPRKPKHGHIQFAGLVEATYTTFEDGTVRLIFVPPVLVQPSKWHKRKLDVLEVTPK